MSIRGFRELAGALALIWTMAGSGAEASTIYTYSFEQTGYAVDWTHAGVQPGTLHGSFTGTADTSDQITLSTLRDFHVAFDTLGTSASYSGLPTFFSFKIGETNNGLFILQTPLPLFPGVSSEACVGLAVPVLCGGGTARGYIRVGTAQVLLSSRTEIGPTVTLVSAINSPAVATTPLPGALPLFGTALCGLGLATTLRRKSTAARQLALRGT